MRPCLCRLSALIAVSAFLRPQSHILVCHLLWLGTRAAHTAALVPHLHLPALKTASCVLPWTSLSPHLVLPVWQEMTRQLTRRWCTPAAPHAQVIHGNLSLFWQWTIPPVRRVLLWPAVTPILTPHFIPFSWVAVPAELSSVGGPWNFRSCWAWSRGLNFLPLFAALNHRRAIPSCFQFIDKSSLCSANMVSVVTDPSGDVTPSHSTTS